MQTSLWMRSASWDILWILNGLWLFPLGIFFYYSPWATGFLNYLVIASPLVGGLHSFLPLLAVFASPAFREKILASKDRVVLIAALIFFGSVLFGVAGSFFLRAEFWLALGSIYLLWNTWHFSAQNFGVLSLYRARQGAESNQALDRKVDRYFCLLMGCLVQPMIWLCVEVRWGPFLKWLGPWVPGSILTNITLFLAVALTLSFCVFEWRKSQRSWPRLGYALSMGIQPFAGVIAYYPFHFLTYSIPHWLVEIGITGTIQTKDAEARSGRGWLALVGFVAASLLLIYFLEPGGEENPLVFSWWDQLRDYDLYSLELREQMHLAWSLPTLFMLMVLPRSFLHFYLSRQIYKSTHWTLSHLNKSSSL